MDHTNAVRNQYKISLIPPLSIEEPVPSQYIAQGHVYMCVMGIEFVSVSMGRRSRNHMVVGFPTTCAISTYHY